MTTREEYEEYEARLAEFLSQFDGNPSCGRWGDDEFECNVADSSRPCAACGTRLLGARHPVIAWRSGARYLDYPAADRWSGLACDDCVYYFEYGRLDDMTMVGIEEEHA